MKAIRVHQQGGREMMVLEEIAVPEPKPGEVRVKVAAAGLNFIDVYQRSGQYKMPLPFTPGMEAAGVVDALGAGVHGVHVGERVAYCMVSGAYAEYALAPAAKLVPVPDAVGMEQAAALMVQGMTAHYLALSTYPLKPGDTALVHAAAGGAGRLLVQIAKRCGARVLATVGSQEKAVLARSAGADEVILYNEVDFEAVVKEVTGGKGVEVVYDSVGKTTFDKSLNCLRPRGYMVLYGQASGAVGLLDPQILNAKGSLFLTRPSLGHYLLTRDELLSRSGDLFDWLAAGELDVRIDQVFALAQAADAHAYIEGRRTMGKVVLRP